jgi:hypothetical protein
VLHIFGGMILWESSKRRKREREQWKKAGNIRREEEMLRNIMRGIIPIVKESVVGTGKRL